MKLLTTQTIRKFSSLMNRSTCDEFQHVGIPIATKKSFPIGRRATQAISNYRSFGNALEHI